ncbi:MAG: SCO family protein [Candidatus Dactylopiibacterium carminicum]|uniref:SCO family protein n=1 Tax=Candidatus Dactylopiibacterium carminicum TaxID=857335 RepID=A0A272EPR1_9RHOO|nr:SCO family protein [Candidatus Dactylopiibacterium carminicum]KAF7598371.1 SCO family protein [Candidatus Dactylopiibacterium carminicum]PAS92114.1 MAG: SCO family protein [Candidatus Dactylopiibacterium carminicum]PAS95538.1 MAG: SCO family protein [Candidatus Dactylopiibacterium carminicum]PAS97477.1 MAG: hypothetical protein BSR46_13620 [Candidatus Dactylopiibacterium carminicum]
MKRRQFITALLAGIALPGCDDGPRFNNVSTPKARYGPGLQRLRDQHGRTHTLADFQGKVVAVFFGYTFCPDVCPTSLMMLRQTQQLLGADGARVQVIFVSVDPGRDTPERLGRYVTAFNPDYLALSGSEAELAAVAGEFGVYYKKKNDSGDFYTIDHTAGCYVFDPAGQARLFVRHGETPQRLAEDLCLLLAGQ